MTAFHGFKTVEDRFIYHLQLPQITEVIPERGPEAGGTRFTIAGNDLGIGTRQISIYVKSAAIWSNTSQEKKECTKAKVYPEISLQVEDSNR